MAWFPDYRDSLPTNPTVKDELRNVVWRIGHTSLSQTYDEIAKIQWAFFKLGYTFPKNDKQLIKLINKMTDDEALFMKEAWRYEQGALDTVKWRI